MISDNNNPNHELIVYIVIIKFFDICAAIIKSGTVLGVSFFVFKCTEVLAGKTTLADTTIVLKYFTSSDNDHFPSFLLVILITIWALLERGLRKRKTEFFQKRIKELELNVDPNRTSSGLLPTGDTNPKDK